MLISVISYRDKKKTISGEGTVRRGDYKNYYKGHMDKIKGEGGSGEGRGIWLAWGAGMGRKGIQL